MRSALLSDLIRHFDKEGTLKVGHCAKDLSIRIEALAIPTALKRILQWHWLNAPGQIGRYRISSVEQVLASRDLVRLMPSMVPFGSARNGDPLVIRVVGEKEYEVGLVSHDQLWGNPNLDACQAYVRVTPTLEEFLVRSVEGMYLPVDFYAAKDLEAVRASISANLT